MKAMEDYVKMGLGNKYNPDKNRYSLVHPSLAAIRLKEGWKLVGDYEGGRETPDRLVVISKPKETTDA